MTESTAAASLVLGIETSCDETASAVVGDARDVLSSVVSSQVDLRRGRRSTGQSIEQVQQARDPIYSRMKFHYRNISLPRRLACVKVPSKPL